ncbi:hypothetical protein [Burkholderia vietnamiensis]|uniref:hypothetical protein n=1 Tax=Burkholderia vietnamiensis TaxID=60552 RepID=UPI001CF42CFA|nr:hypothetical protein [Burkholderia vietnamiensis]MCA8448926.1 hypothetical protein [Burkholderia vietnamiensis]
MTMSTKDCTDGSLTHDVDDVERHILTIARSMGRSMSLLERDWEMALDEEAIREALKDAMPADAPSRPRARL